MLKPKSPQESFYGSYLYERIVPADQRSPRLLISLLPTIF
jgi:hypothetical protein